MKRTPGVSRQLTSRRNRLASEPLFSLVVFLVVLVAPQLSIGGQLSPVDFGRNILPILSANCFQCHGPDEGNRKAELRLDIREGALRIKDGTAAVIPGDRSKSELIRRITTKDPDDVMPPARANRKLAPDQIDLLARWIDAGAPWSGHWAFEPITAPDLPKLERFGSKVRDSIDLFVLRRLEEAGLEPSPEASKEMLIRRASLDLTGLPPTIDEVEEFLADDHAAAYETLIERLLQSPAFGERMAWSWLDAARYADSNGYQGDSERTMWPWRDWVVNALNRNLPFDQFTVFQLAGDLLPAPDLEQRLATGFSRNHMINGEGGRIPEENRVDYVMDMMETTGTVWLGLTLNCCRCHDHKFDPLSRKDYYRFFAFFNQTPVTGSGGDPQTKPVLPLPTVEQTSRLTTIQDRVQTIRNELEETETRLFTKPSESAGEHTDSTGAIVSAEALNILKKPVTGRSSKELSELEKAFKTAQPEYTQSLADLRKHLEEKDRIQRSIVKVMVMEEMPEERKTFMLDKGIYDKPGEEVTANVPERLPPLNPGAPNNRLGLAEWIVSPQNPLTARVIVNRVWQQFFGIGLVKTSENFGVQGEFPSHPQLLDSLAFEFVRSGWNLKELCYRIVTSATYRQSSRVTPELESRDPENRLLARGSRFRMPSWMIRDQALAASGLLTRKMSGKPVNAYQPSGVWEEATFGNKKYTQDQGDALYRRSLYTFWRRIVGPTMFFDSASRQTCTVKLPRTNSPLHALTTLNDITFVEAARALAERVLLSPAQSVNARVALAFRSVLARQPKPEEQEVLSASFERLKKEFESDIEASRLYVSVGESKFREDLDSIELAAMSGVCLAILNLDEAVTKE